MTTSDRTLLQAVRATLDGADDAFLCVAFVQEKGLHLLRSELERLRRRQVPARLLVTTTFQMTSPSALSMASDLGLEVRVLNPSGCKTFHPKLYLGNAGGGSRAVIGSANLTGGLFAHRGRSGLARRPLRPADRQGLELGARAVGRPTGPTVGIEDGKGAGGSL